MFCTREKVEDLGVALGAAAELEVDHGDGSLTAVVLGVFFGRPREGAQTKRRGDAWRCKGGRARVAGEVVLRRGRNSSFVPSMEGGMWIRSMSCRTL
jgi:hypothetical protein